MTAKARLVASLLVGTVIALTTFFLVRTYEENKWGRVVSELRAEQEQERRTAAEALAQETGRVLELQQRLNEAAQAADLDHKEKEDEIDRLEADNRRLARELGGLRDPGHRPAARCAAAPAEAGGAGGAPDPASDGRLSDEATEFLLTEARRADEVANWAGTCWRWLQGQGLVKP
ncbi:hypothetical protein AIIMSPlu_005 [Pseudomonas phage AIIMS-Plu-RaNi]|nr:hypothetical protein AIIMSPlu_005 [Pseudomonas phage AIIMS-Plu-RaNi]